MRLFRSGLIVVLLAAASSAAYSQVYRCGNEYSHQPCAGGKEVDVSPPVSDPAGPSRVQIFFCRSPQQKFLWMSDACSTIGWTLIRSEWVPAGLDFGDQVKFANQKHQSTLKRITPVQAQAPVYQQQQPVQSHKSQCADLEERINWLDSLGRAGGSSYRMDWIREERRLARDRQFRLRC